MKIIKPNFFIIGAPRCGTSALSEYLRSHPSIGFSEPKETQFFATDMPNIRHVDNELEYLEKYFSKIDNPEMKMVGEGSVWHLFSEDAVQNILKFNPAARFIVMVRNPIDLVQALHEKLLELLFEDCEFFEKSWRLQARRKNGMDVPKGCPEPRLLMYGEIGLLGKQIERLMQYVPKNQLLVVCFDDFVKDTHGVYLKVLEFLRVSDDGRDSFPKINEGRRIRWIWAYEIISLPSPLLQKVVFFLKKFFGIKRLGIQSFLRNQLLVSRNKKQSISPAFLKELQDHFEEDVKLLGKLINRDLSTWLKSDK